jgi:hypothetical protein
MSTQDYTPKKLCVNCEHFAEGEGDSGASSGTPQSKFFGSCHAHPPVRAFPQESAFRWIFPAVTEADWCGEYRQRGEK